MSATHTETPSYKVNQKARVAAQRINDSSRKRRFANGLRTVWYQTYRQCRLSARLGFIERSTVHMAIMQWRHGGALVHTGYIHVSQAETFTETGVHI